VLGFSESWQRQFHNPPQATGLEAGIEGLHIQVPACKLLQHFDAVTPQHYKQPSALQTLQHIFAGMQNAQFCSQYKAFSAAEEHQIKYAEWTCVWVCDCTLCLSTLHYLVL